MLSLFLMKGWLINYYIFLRKKMLIKCYIFREYGLPLFVDGDSTWVHKNLMTCGNGICCVACLRISMGKYTCKSRTPNSLSELPQKTET